MEQEHTTQQSHNDKHQHHQSTVYFRCANKISYPVQLSTISDLKQMAQRISKSQNIPVESIKFMHRGSEIRTLAELKQKKDKSIIHVVNLAQAHKKQITITINFGNQRKKQYSVNSQTKVGDFMQSVMAEHNLSKFILVHLGTKIGEQLSFQEILIEDKSQLIATGLQYIQKGEQKQQQIQAILQKTNKKPKAKEHQMLNLEQKKQEQKNSLEKEQHQQQNRSNLIDVRTTKSLLSQESPKALNSKLQFNENGIPVSDIFCPHRHIQPTFPFNKIHPSPKIPVTPVSSPNESKTQTFQTLKKNSRSSTVLTLQPKDFIFCAHEDLMETTNFLSQTLLSLKKQLKNRR